MMDDFWIVEVLFLGDLVYGQVMFDQLDDEVGVFFGDVVFFVEVVCVGYVEYGVVIVVFFCNVMEQCCYGQYLWFVEVCY